MPKLDDFFAAGLDRLPENRRLPDALRQAIEAAPVPGLLDEPRDGKLALQIKQHADDLPPLVVSGLWLLAGELDLSHSLSQSDDSVEGSFWHGIMHRREGDFSNAKYWFRRVGEHPVFARLAQEYPDQFTDPSSLVDQIQTVCGRGGSDLAATQVLQTVQWTEWQWLMLDCLDSDSADS